MTRATGWGNEESRLCPYCYRCARLYNEYQDDRISEEEYEERLKALQKQYGRTDRRESLSRRVESSTKVLALLPDIGYSEEGAEEAEILALKILDRVAAALAKLRVTEDDLGLFYHIIHNPKQRNAYRGGFDALLSRVEAGGSVNPITVYKATAKELSSVIGDFGFGDTQVDQRIAGYLRRKLESTDAEPEYPDLPEFSASDNLALNGMLAELDDDERMTLAYAVHSKDHVKSSHFSELIDKILSSQHTVLQAGRDLYRGCHGDEIGIGDEFEVGAKFKFSNPLSFSESRKVAESFKGAGDYLLHAGDSPYRNRPVCYWGLMAKILLKDKRDFPEDWEDAGNDYIFKALMEEKEWIFPSGAEGRVAEVRGDLVKLDLSG
jgi:hypothetical protein